MATDPSVLFPELPQSRYSRLCPGEAWVPHDPEKLKELARLMDAHAPPDASARLSMPSGYVYFGQFVDHDLTRDNTPLTNARPQAGATMNCRRAAPDLEVLYGDGPVASSALYLDGGKLRLGETESYTAAVFPHHSYPASPNDLWRDGDGQAVVVDYRSDENVCRTSRRLSRSSCASRSLLPEASGRFPLWEPPLLLIGAYLCQRDPSEVRLLGCWSAQRRETCRGCDEGLKDNKCTQGENSPMPKRH